MTHIAHLSDLHFGSENPRVCIALHEALMALEPDLIAVSGDLTQRARKQQFEAARKFLTQLPGELLIVPGNHDVPLFDLPTRLIQPYRNYHAHFGEHQSAAINAGPVTLLGVDSTRRWRHKEGWLGRRGDRSIPLRLPTRADGHILGMVTHHPLQRYREASGPNARQAARKTVARLHRLGVDFILCGHDHHPRTHWFDLIETDEASVSKAEQGILQVSAGTAISTRTREHPNSFNLLRIEVEPGKRAQLHNQRWDYHDATAEFTPNSEQSVLLSRRP